MKENRREVFSMQADFYRNLALKMGWYNLYAMENKPHKAFKVLNDVIGICYLDPKKRIKIRKEVVAGFRYHHHKDSSLLTKKEREKYCLDYKQGILKAKRDNIWREEPSLTDLEVYLKELNSSHNPVVIIYGFTEYYTAKDREIGSYGHKDPLVEEGVYQGKCNRLEASYYSHLLQRKLTLLNDLASEVEVVILDALADHTVEVPVFQATKSYWTPREKASAAAPEDDEEEYEEDIEGELSVLDEGVE